MKCKRKQITYFTQAKSTYRHTSKFEVRSQPFIILEIRKDAYAN